MPCNLANACKSHCCSSLQIDPATKAGYTPLHVACHFGQMNMVRFLLQHGAKVNSTTQLGLVFYIIHYCYHFY